MKIMAIDYGDARTGFAISDRSEFLASPIGTVPERNAERLADKAAQTAAEVQGVCRAFERAYRPAGENVGRAFHYCHSTQYP